MENDRRWVLIVGMIVCLVFVIPTEFVFKRLELDWVEDLKHMENERLVISV